MDAVSYPEKSVTEFITSSMIPLRVLYNALPLANDFNVKWTPTLITLDSDGKEHHRTVGFLAPDELIPSLLLGIAKTHFDLNELNEALTHLKRILSYYPKSSAAPEAIYLNGVCLYKNMNDAKKLKEAYERLQTEYPSSEWAKRASPYGLL
ncbi:MAG TPA: hypothetical protein DHU69_02545 [Deltaproteobacteria bacterium]|nr:MAG: hypothetical protein A2067_04525 [Deltaproteobacteria bacterium GWB2_42_7]OGP44194.1 MAG: hypothetical protein A2090_02665 [Deltaproteobacteria bacterium GWD2_42_10]OGP47116.1 MAG: hypothetical protein A2022_08270 [Deltaproteobacteria bacterium GWF2_42_12]OGQ26701.1 MAG: hypothetical protein A3D29_05460 [Deltaproteobacteria bacterium RIFCSPHIGHO2_02_FULL_42_44]OGQ38172.1 MAG: hypothetical protein A3H47_05740 [Deltaproteobacteria bacterium RIFCSPLOWO2_02_FULL_42_39]OGQ69004.1 MAG: hypot